VAVSVQNAVATLTGSVGSYTEKQLVARIAKSVKGQRTSAMTLQSTTWLNAPTRKSRLT